MKTFRILLACSALAGALSAQPAVKQAAQQTTPPKTHLKIGDEAPDFTLPDTTGKPVKLSDFKGNKNVVLAFFPAAFTGG